MDISISIVFPFRVNQALPPSAKSVDAAIAKMAASGYVLCALNKMRYDPDALNKMVALTLLNAATKINPGQYGWPELGVLEGLPNLGTGRRWARDRGGHIGHAVLTACRRIAEGRVMPLPQLVEWAFPMTTDAIRSAEATVHFNNTREQLGRFIEVARKAAEAEWEICAKE